MLGGDLDQHGYPLPLDGCLCSAGADVEKLLIYINIYIYYMRCEALKYNFSLDAHRPSSLSNQKIYK